MISVIIKTKKRLSTISFIVSAGLFYLLIFWLINQLSITKESINEFIQPLGLKGIIVTTLLQFSISLTPLPDTLVMLPSLILYGPVIGSLTSITGIVSASAVHFNIAKRINKKLIFKYIPISKSMLHQFSEKIRIEKLILYNVFSFVSFDVIAYLAGMGGVGFVKFIVASACALIPILIPNILISIGLLTKDPVKLAFIWLLTICTVVSSVYLAKKVKGKFALLK